jgi:hypothetical protein
MERLLPRCQRPHSRSHDPRGPWRHRLRHTTGPRVAQRAARLGRPAVGAVADGMSEQPHGEVASAMAIFELALMDGALRRRRARRGRPARGGQGRRPRRVAADDEAAHNPGLRGVGTTVVVMLVDGVRRDRPHRGLAGLSAARRLCCATALLRDGSAARRRSRAAHSRSHARAGAGGRGSHLRRGGGRPSAPLGACQTTSLTAEGTWQ